MERLYERSENTPQYKAFVQKERGQKLPEDNPMYYTGEAFKVPKESKSHPKDMWGKAYYVVGVGSSPIPKQVRFRLAAEKKRRKLMESQRPPQVEENVGAEIDFSDWTTSGHLKVAKFILNKDEDYLSRIVSTFANWKDKNKLERLRVQIARVSDVKPKDGDDDFASYWLPKLRKAYYILRSPKSEGKPEAGSIIDACRQSLKIPNPNLI